LAIDKAPIASKDILNDVYYLEVPSLIIIKKLYFLKISTPTFTLKPLIRLYPIFTIITSGSFSLK